LPACTGGGDEIVIGVVGPSSGPGAEIGLASRRGANLAAKDLNRTGGIGGRQIKIEYRDDAEAFRLPEILRDLAVGKKASAIIGPETLAAVANPSGPLREVSTPFLSIVPEGALGDRVFRLSPSADDQASVLAHWLVEVRRFERVAIAASDDAAGRAGAEAMERALGDAGRPPVAVRRFPAGLPDPSPVVAALRESNPGALVIWAGPDDAARLLGAVRDRKWGVQVAGPLTLFDPDYRSLAGTRTENTAFVLPHREHWFTQDLVEWFLGYNDAYGVLTIPKQLTLIPALSYLDMLAYDAVKLVAEAVSRGGSRDADEVLAALQDGAKVKGVFAEYRFDGSDHEGFEPDELWMARLSNFAFLYDADPRADRALEIASYKVQVSAFYVPQDFLRSPRGRRIQQRILDQVLTDPENVDFFRDYRPPRPPPGPL
jgi:branched-chain amino acid transport system substrate-binding protein